MPGLQGAAVRAVHLNAIDLMRGVLMHSAQRRLAIWGVQLGQLYASVLPKRCYSTDDLVP